MALDWLRRAGSQATVWAPTIAAELLERATELFDAADPDGDSLLADWTISVEALGRVREAEATCAELLGRRQPPVTEPSCASVWPACCCGEGARRMRPATATLAEQIEGIDHAAPPAHGPLSPGYVRGAAAGGCRASARMVRSWSQPTNG